MVHWVLQNKVTSEENLAALTKAFRKYKCTHDVVQVIPFDPEVPDITPTCYPVVAYGSTTFVERIYQKRPWAPGVYFDRSKFCPSYWTILLGDDALNSDGYNMVLRAVPDMLQDGQLYFARPDNDGKLFPGMVLDKQELMTVVNNTDQLDSLIWIAPPKNLGKEWRLFVVNHRIITGSQYRSKGRLNVSKTVPSAVKLFAQHAIIKLCATGGTYVLDVCEYNKQYKVIELGCLNAAGFYAADIDKIVQAVVDKEHQPHPNPDM